MNQVHLCENALSSARFRRWRVHPSFIGKSSSNRSSQKAATGAKPKRRTLKGTSHFAKVAAF
jgi:hypothetical protein